MLHTADNNSTTATHYQVVTEATTEIGNHSSTLIQSSTNCCLSRHHQLKLTIC